MRFGKMVFMKEIILTQDKVALVDDHWYEELNNLKWFYHTGTRALTGYAWHYIPKTMPAEYLVMHRLIMKAEKGQQIDHIDRNGLNNLESNLRFSTQSQNMHNTGLQSNNTHGVKGVCFHRRCVSRPWSARIHINKKSISLGYFATKEEAALAYNKAALELLGEFAVLNKL